MDYTLSDYAFFLTVKAYLPAILAIIIIISILILFYFMIIQLMNYDGKDGGSHGQRGGLPRIGSGAVINRLENAVSGVRRNGKLDVERAVEIIHKDEESAMVSFLSLA